MSTERNEGLPADIDPKKLIVQEGEDKGRIAEPDLAQTGAEREKLELEGGANYPIIDGYKARLFYEKERGVIFDGADDKENEEIALKMYLDEASKHEMGREVGQRASDHLGGWVGHGIKREVGDAAHVAFVDELTAKQKEIKAEDEAKAQELFRKLKGSEKEQEQEE